MYWISPKFIFKFDFWSVILVRQFFIFKCWIHKFIIKNIQEPLKKVPSQSSKFSNYLHFGPPYWICHLLFSNFKLRFVISDVHICKKNVLFPFDLIGDWYLAVLRAAKIESEFKIFKLRISDSKRWTQINAMYKKKFLLPLSFQLILSR